MIFSSYQFIFIFLPLVIAVWVLLRKLGFQALMVPWLVAVSVFYFAWWDWRFVGLLAGSIVFNFFLGQKLAALARVDAERRLRSALVLGVALNLSLLAYFKYLNFFVSNLSALVGGDYSIFEIILPIGLSFFTFQQIAFLVDARRGETAETNIFDYALFVSFFPQLIAGPIVHHKEMMGQFRQKKNSSEMAHAYMAGATIFIVGLSKKVLIADTVAVWSTQIFDASEAGKILTLLDAWTGALAFTFQIYFDFSGYSDMAIGLGLIFGLSLPINFNSPYKAASIIDFWRRWHMTLSRFLADYLYIPLGGNRKGRFRRYLNLMITMLLGGLWHGAGWNFIIWGGLHGAYLVFNHAWRLTVGSILPPSNSGSFAMWSGRLLTFLAVVVAWVFFRAETFSGAIAVLEGMLGFNGLVLPSSWQVLSSIIDPVLNLAGGRYGETISFGRYAVIFMIALLAFVFVLPNTNEIMRLTRKHQNLDFSRAATIAWRPSIAVGIMIGILFALSVSGMNSRSEFIYYQF